MSVYNRTKRNCLVGSTNRGFTLMEMLVAMSIFSLLIATAADIFMMANRSERKVFDLQSMQSSSRYTLDAIVREVRTGIIDYGYYAARDQGMETPERVLALIGSDELPIKFYESDATNEQYCQDEQSRPCLLVEVGSYEPSPLSPLGVKVQAVSFFVSPAASPFEFDSTVAGYANDVQPAVTILLSLESVGRKSGERTFLDLQTTATRRLYVR
ncbi:MAG: prepilin-type N-terminal cleavage/methylation domain-containing protein [Patescibacteria group bacterium]